MNITLRSRKHFFLSLTVLAQSFFLFLNGQVLDTNAWITDLHPSVIVSDGYYTYVGGANNYIMPYTGTGAKTDNLGNYIPGNKKINDTVFTSINDGGDGFYIGGSFTRTGDIVRNHLAHILTDGSTGPWNPDLDGTVYSVCMDAFGNIFAGGNFITVGGDTSRYLAKIKPDGTLDATFAPKIDNIVRSVAMDDTGNIYIGGLFTNVGGLTREYVAKIKPSGIVDSSWNVNFNAYVNAVSLDDSAYAYVGGEFTMTGILTRNYIARIKPNGTLDSSWQYSVNSTVHSITIDLNGYIYAGGQFTSLESLTRNHITRFIPDGTIDSVWNPDINGDIFCITTDNYFNVFIGGNFSQVNGETRNKTAKLLNDGTIESWNPNPYGGSVIRTISTDSYDNVYAGGDFSCIGGRKSLYLARLKPDGTADAWDPGLSAGSSINAMSVDYAGNLYVAGNFSTVSGQPRTNLVKFLPSGLVDSWLPDVDNSVTGIIADSAGSVYITGSFTTINGIPKQYIARLKPGGGIDNSWNPIPDGDVKCMTLNINKNLFIQGSFNNISGTPKKELASIKPDGTLDSWNANNTNGSINTIATDAMGNLFIGGSFSAVGSETRNNIAKFKNDGTLDSWNPGADNTVESIFPYGGIVYIGGTFSALAGSSRSLLGKVKADGTTDVWNPQLTGDSITGITADMNNNLWIIGNIQKAEGRPRESIAKYTISKPAEQSKDILSKPEDTYAQISFKPGSGSRHLVLLTQTTNSAPIPADSITFLSDLYFGNGSQVDASQWYCVYKGSDTSVRITGLTQETKYRVAVYDFDGADSYERYLSVPAAGNPDSFRTKKSQTISFTAIPLKTYGNPKFALNATATSSLTVVFTSSDPGVAQITGDSVTITGAGSAVIKAYQPGNLFYAAAAIDSNNLQVDKNFLTITADNKTRKYGEHNPPLTISYSGFQYNDDAASIVAPAISCLADSSANAGNHPIKLTGGSSSNYYITSINGTLTIDKIDLTISADNKTRKYAVANPTFTLSYSGFINGENNLSLTTQPAASSIGTLLSNAGNYDINVIGGSSLNYNLIRTKGTLTIEKVDLTATADNKSRQYGLPNPVFTISYSGFVNGDNKTSITEPTINCTAGLSTTVGNYPIALSGGSSVNYNFLYVNGTLTIDKGGLTAKADHKSRTYGQHNPAFTKTYIGFKNGETEAVITEPIVSCAADSSSNATTYDIELTGGSAPNYNLSLVNGQLTVIKKPLNATAQNKSKNYGDPNPAFNISYSGFVNGDDNTKITEPTASCSADNLSNAGSYNILVNGGSGTNYNIIPVNGTLQINKIALSVTAENKTRKYGDTNPAFTSTYSGFINGDDKTDLTEPGISCTAISSSVVGSYDITLSGGLSTNYTFTLNKGILTVEKADLTITATNKTRKYGEANPVFDLNYSGFKNGENNTSISEPTSICSATQTSNAGDYDITLSGGASNNYNLFLVKGNLKIDKVDLSVKPENIIRKYGETNPKLILKYTGFVNGDDTSDITEPTAATTADKTSNVGTYDINVSGGISPNYNLKYSKGVLEITKATLTVTADNKTWNTSETKPILTISYSGFVNNDDVNALTTKPTFDCKAGINDPAGNYDITVSGGSDENYSFIYKNGILSLISAIGFGENLSGISFYPNPAKDYLTIINPDKNTFGVQVYNLIGQKLIEKNISGEHLDIQWLQSGEYILKVDGVVFSFIKQ